MKYMEEHELHGIVLTGRPYHLDPEVNHGIDNVINQQGMVVLTEDSVSGMAEFPRPIRILDQWVYHSRGFCRTAGRFGCGAAELIRMRSRCGNHR